ncbi:hypothetical protein HYV86_03805 [Candidatus Woesearchaeota archaeon]|nr:hypothetical protein [Candidatus Woesearchaeota archaeon]
MVAKKRSADASPRLLWGVELHRLAHYTFFAGIVVCILVGVFFRTKLPPEMLVSTLVLLGLIVGLFNLTAKETTPFLVAAVALMLAGIVNLQLFTLFGLWPNLGNILRSVLSNIVVFVVPGAIIVGMKVIWKLARN